MASGGAGPPFATLGIMRRPPRSIVKRSRWMLVAALLLGAAGQAGAQDLAARAHAAVALDGSTLTLERGRAPAGFAADGRPSQEVSGFSYRWWLRSGPARFGVGVGALGPVVTPLDPAVNGGARLAYAASTVTVGLRLRVSEGSVVYADASSARPLGPEPGGDLFATKLGVEWARSSHSRFGFERGAFGMQLDSGYRMSLRAKHGGLGVYLRGRF